MPGGLPYTTYHTCWYAWGPALYYISHVLVCLGACPILHITSVGMPGGLPYTTYHMCWYAAGGGGPSQRAMVANAEQLATYAKASQVKGQGGWGGREPRHVR